MAEPHVVAALKDKRAELSGNIADLEKRIGQHRADLLHVDAVLRLFAPEFEPATIPPRAVRRPNSWFKPGELARLRGAAHGSGGADGPRDYRADHGAPRA